MFFQVSVANVENAHHSTRQWLFFVRIKKRSTKKTQDSTKKTTFFADYWPRPPWGIFWGQRTCTKSSATEKAYLPRCRFFFLYVLVQKVVGQFATNIVKQTTFWMMETLTFDTKWTILNYREVYWYSRMWHLWSPYLILICDRKCWTRRRSPGASKLSAWRCRLLHLIDWLFVAFKLKWYIARSIKT